MPAIYAHDRFGEKVAKKLDGELKRFVLNITRSLKSVFRDRTSSFSTALM